MSLKRKLSSQKTPLSVVDIIVYCFFIAISFLASLFVIVFLGSIIPERIAYSVDSAVAYIESVVPVMGMVFWVSNFMCIMVCAMEAMRKKQPLLKVKQMKPTPFKHYIKATPLFSKKFWREISVKTKKMIRIAIVSLTVSFVIGGIIASLGICIRTTLDSDNFIREYNSFNQVKKEEPLENADLLIIDIDKVRSKRSRTHWYVDIEFVFGKESYSFRTNQFGNKSRKESLEYMLHIKEQFGAGRYTINDDEKIEDLFFYENLSSYEQQLVNELFDVEA